VKPTQINQVYQASFAELRIRNHPMHFVLAVMDCFSRYLLVLRISSSNLTEDLTTGLDVALREARRVSGLSQDGVITLLTDGGPRVTAAKFSDYISSTPFNHVPCTSRPFRALGMVKRLIWALKDEEMNLREYRDPVEAQLSLERFRHTYNSCDRTRHYVIGFRQTCSARSLPIRPEHRITILGTPHPTPPIGTSEESALFSHRKRLDIRENL
jgi:transposase InsO family protein